jgi:hypothetical protein
MNRPIAIVGAPSSIGIRPYDSGEQRRVDRAPAVLRKLSVIERLEVWNGGVALLVEHLQCDPGNLPRLGR